MRRVCAWCGEGWDASRIDPPMTEPYFCPRCQRYEGVWHTLRKEGKDDRDAEEKEKPPTAMRRCGRQRHTEVRQMTLTV